LGSFREIIFLLLLGGGTLFISNLVVNGSLKTTANLGGELKSAPDSLYTWKIGDEAPFKYRMVHKSIVLTTFNLVSHDKTNNDLFFFVYRTYAVIFHIGAILLFYYFLLKIDLADVALAGAAIFALLPPVLLAYNVPVHTREDTIAYCLLIAGLLAIINNHAPSIFIATLLGVFCRETMLLLPFVNLFFNRKQNIWLRFTIAGAGVGTFFIIRFTLGLSPYDYLEGFHWNLNNLEQVIGFSFITFGPLWIPFFLSFVKTKTTTAIITPSGATVFALIVVTTFFGGIFNEIRLLYLLAPWVIVSALSLYRDHANEIKATVGSGQYRTFLLAVLMLFIALILCSRGSVERLAGMSKYDIPFGAWITVAIAQGCLCIASLPIWIRLIRSGHRNKQA
jgi:hypothetical protein